VRSFLTVLAVTVVAAAGAASASATSATGNQNSALVVSVSLSPDVAANGDVVTASETVTNASSTKQAIVVTSVLTDPSGASRQQSRKIVLRPGDSFTQSSTYTVAPDDARGVYTLTVTATAAGGSSSATASVTYV
jgi:hypothetical protein